MLKEFKLVPSRDRIEWGRSRAGEFYFIFYTLILIKMINKNIELASVNTEGILHMVVFSLRILCIYLWCIPKLYLPFLYIYIYN